jgi:hypothetical protein
MGLPNLKRANEWAAGVRNDFELLRGESFDLATDFVPKQRYWWEGNGVKVPDAKILVSNDENEPTKCDFR